MKNKAADVPYTGVREEVIKDAQPTMNDKALGILTKWITERYKIRVKKDVDKVPAPWTDCPILQKVKFTNVFREDDRATIWLIDNVCNNDQLSYENKILNCILFRLYNKIETCELIGMPLDFGSIKYKGEIQEVLENRVAQDPKYVFFTSAFNTGGFKAGSVKHTGEQYIPMRPVSFMEYIINDDIVQRLMDAESPEFVIKELMEYTGIGKFLSYQIFVDFTYIEEYPFSENEYTVSGPGCSLGLSFLFEDEDGMNDAECLFWLRDNHEVLNIDWEELLHDRAPHDRKTNVMSLENNMCEFSKYYRCTEKQEAGETVRARVKYDGEGFSGATLDGFFK